MALVVHGFGETSRYNGGITFEIPLYQTLDTVGFVTKMVEEVCLAIRF